MDEDRTLLMARIRDQLVLPTRLPITRMDITPILEGNPVGFRFIVDEMTGKYMSDPPDAILSIESFGHLFASPMAHKLGCRLLVARQLGRLPRPAFRVDYDMVYASGKTLEIHRDALSTGMRVAIVDDVVASGGSVEAAARLVRKGGAAVVGISCFVEVENLGARERLLALDQKITSILQVRYDFLREEDDGPKRLPSCSGSINRHVAADL